ncbi:leucine-rich repeat, immunoglobulin-like domain and transmembrane domain-containing protein 3b [Colossoma macropomum]|uniref:leucine-rich repeat, immunoglobulin-like domain and transmembrane domain-containing protein 3b n=1 Tax=Colossoma macropomum TaxID=42526 RepID=UPI001863F5B3|nr:leucine-rich repeat, immunoglobulin-like domain and transmembrane domain-containing protein 3b [Colossoma macropomum]
MHTLLCVHLLLGLAFAVHAQNDTCPSLCTCAFHGRSNGKGLRTVLCKNPSLTAIPVNLPSDTVKFRLERTSVSRVFRGAFSTLPNLVYLWLTYNSITIVHPRSFTNLTFLHELRLDGNLLSTFPWEALRDTPRLRTLGLHNNRLSRVPPQAARFLGNITYLDLSSNRLSTLPNELTTLWPLTTQSEPQRSVVLGLQDNPWLCDCRLSVLLDISKAPESSLVLLDRFLTCIGPPDLAGVPFQSVDLPRCRRPSVLTSATKVTTLLGSNVLLRCDARGYPTPALIWIKSARPNLYNTVVQESPRKGLRWSVISLNGISYKDAGEYRCRAQNMAGTSEAIISLNVVGVINGNSDSKKPAAPKSPLKPPSERKPNQRLKMTPSLFPKNVTGGLLSPPKRILTTLKASRDKMKRDRTGRPSLPQS